MFRIAKHLMRGTPAEDDSVHVSELNGVRSLHLGSDTIQSAMRVREPFALELSYTRAMMCFMLFKDSVNTMLTLGLGGGSLAKYIYANCPQIHATVVEINPNVIRIARSQFFVPENDARFEVIEADGLKYMQILERPLDLLVLDAFDRNGIAPELSSQSFFDLCADALQADGILIANLWGSDKNFDVYVGRIEQSCNGGILILPTGKPGNVLVFGFKREPADLRISTLRMRAKSLEKTHKIEFLQFIDKLVQRNASTANRIFTKSEH